MSLRSLGRKQRERSRGDTKLVGRRVEPTGLNEDLNICSCVMKLCNRMGTKYEYQQMGMISLCGIQIGGRGEYFFAMAARNVAGIITWSVTSFRLIGMDKKCGILQYHVR